MCTLHDLLLYSRREMLEPREESEALVTVVLKVPLGFPEIEESPVTLGTMDRQDLRDPSDNQELVESRCYNLTCLYR